MITHNREAAMSKSWATVFHSPEGNPGGGSDPSKEQQAKELVEHFKDIDLNELPTNVRTAIENARATIGTLQKSTTDATAKLAETQNFARIQQSRADKLDSVVRRHNLPTDGSQTAPVGPVGDEAAIAERATRLEKQHGLKPEAAMVYAKMLHDEAKQQRADLLKEFSPLVANIGNMQANSALQEVAAKNSTFFAIPEVKTFVENAVLESTKNNRPVTVETVNRLMEMGYGAYAMKNPDKITKNDTTIPNLGNPSMSQGGHVSSGGQRTGNQAPVAKEPETIAIMSKVVQDWKKDLPSQKGKK